MGKKVRRSRNRSHTQQKTQKPVNKTLETIIKEGNLNEAIRILSTQVSIAPTDDNLKLLGQCYVDLEKYDEAANTF